MSLTRKMLKAMGIEDEKIDQIIDAHTETVDALKNERDNYKTNSDKLAEVQKELDDLKKDVDSNDWKGKYDKEHAEFERYKTGIASKEKEASVKAAYKNLLIECKVGEKQVDAIMGVTDFANMELDKDGKFTNVDELKTAINSKWSGFITTDGIKKSEVDNPPASNGTSGPQASRASVLAKQYNENLYGKAKED